MITSAMARQTRFAAMNVLDGTVIGRNMQRIAHQEFIRFLNAVEREVPAGKTVHAILDNYAATSTPRSENGWARHPRWTFHFTPTSAPGSTPSRASSPPSPSAVSSAASSNPSSTFSRHQPLPRRSQRQVKPFQWVADPEKIIEASDEGTKR